MSAQGAGTQWQKGCEYHRPLGLREFVSTSDKMPNKRNVCQGSADLEC